MRRNVQSAWGRGRMNPGLRAEGVRRGAKGIQTNRILVTISKKNSWDQMDKVFGFLTKRSISCIP